MCMPMACAQEELQANTDALAAAREHASQMQQQLAQEEEVGGGGVWGGGVPMCLELIMAPALPCHCRCEDDCWHAGSCAVLGR